MKKLIIMLFLLILCGCSLKKASTSISLNDTNIIYGKEIYLYDLIEIKDGKIMSSNNLIDTSTLGNKNISIDYIDNNSNKKVYNFSINIIDNIKPVIISSSTITIKKGDNSSLTDNIFCADNYDRNIVCKVEGDYNINKVGEYNLKFTATDVNNNYAEKKFKLVVKNNITYDYDNSYYYLKDAIKTYKNDNTLIGIDVSTWQGDINWNKVLNDGVEFAMIRIGFGHNDNGKIVMDNKFQNNLKNAKQVGLKVGLYFYSYAYNTTDAKKQAEWIVNTLKKETLDLPIAFDFEDWSEFKNHKINLVDLNNIYKVFKKELNDNGYEVMLYGSRNYLDNVWDTSFSSTWLAHYVDSSTYDKPYYIWQFANNGKVNGIDAYVDLNVLYKR